MAERSVIGGLACIGAIAIWASVARADVDLTGSWNTMAAAPVQVEMQQSGTVLTIIYSNVNLTDVGTIDPVTGVLHVPLDVPQGECPAAIDAIAAPDGNSISGALNLAYKVCNMFFPYNCTCEPASMPFSGTRCLDCAPFTCGNGVVDGDDACDDGNAVAGDCCSTSCTFENGSCASDGNPCTTDHCAAGACTHPPTVAGTICPSDGMRCTSDVCDGTGACSHPPAPAGTFCGADGSPCTADVCDSAGACTHGPQTSCRAPSRPAKLDVRRNGARSRLQFLWKDDSGGTALADFGGPSTVTSLRLCVFSGSTLVLDAEAPAAGGCGTPPCWTAKAHGFAYKSKAGTPNGLSKITLKSTPSGRSTLLVKGKGAALPFLGDPTAPVRAQLITLDGNLPRCWDSQ